jgi:hypothetical protein
MVCCVVDMLATCLQSCCRLGDIACRLECLNDTTFEFDDMLPTFNRERPFAQNYSDLTTRPWLQAPPGSYHGLWWTDALDPVHLRDPDIMGDTATGDAAMYWVRGLRPPQPEKFHYFGGDFLYA